MELPTSSLLAHVAWHGQLVAVGYVALPHDDVARKTARPPDAFHGGVPL